ncbi:MAG: 4-(cytidine 5'-diphospho)-2-C-methyl-D-erythritol kinase [Actinomycetes bacterium]
MSAPVPDVVTVRAPAKTNLQLSVGGLRADGFHDLITVYQSVSLYDELVATRAPGGGVRVTVEGAHAAGVPTDGRNLAVRAARVLAEQAGVEPEVHLHVTKGIPVAGGMAGGSADAAAALVACDALWDTGMDRDALLDVAATLGSDVPFALLGGVAVGTGRGEQLTPALVSGTLHWVFVLDEGGLATPTVYAEVDRLRADVPGLVPTVSEPLMAALRSGDPRGVADTLTNDMQAAALSLRPRLRRTLDAGLEGGALAALVSGSGPTCAFLARDAEHALDVAVALTASGIASVVPAHGPVPGARVVSSSQSRPEVR